MELHIQDCRCARNWARTEAVMVEPVKQQAEWRLRCLEGHLAALIRMAEAGQPAPALLLQISAIQGGLEKLVQLLIQHHLKDCLSKASGKKTWHGYERALQELADVYKRGFLMRTGQPDLMEKNFGKDPRRF